MKSLRRQLSLSILLTMLGLAIAAGSGIYFYVRKALLRQYDDALTNRALAFSRLIAWDETGKLIFEIPEHALAEFRRAQRPSYFEIFLPNGKLFASSHSLNGRELTPLTPESERWSLLLPDGLPGRAIAYRFTPHNESDEPKVGAEALNEKPPAPHLPGQALLLLADDQQEVDHFLGHLIETMVVVGMLLAAAMTVAVMTTVRRGLTPLDRVSNEAKLLDPDAPSARFSSAALPVELQPIVERLNELLARVEDALRRERRFTADAAHELRTPIAELRSLADVALKWPPNPSESVKDFTDVLAIARQMERLVESLLAMSQCARGSPIIERRQQNLADLVHSAWKPFAQQAEQRQLRVHWMLEPLSVFTDSALLAPVLRNLFSNAVEYTPHAGTIACAIRSLDGHVQFVINNSCDSLKDEDLQHVLEPFWRKDAARSDGEHSGLGLAVAAGYARLQGIELIPEMIEPQKFQIILRFSVPTEPSTA